MTTLITHTAETLAALPDRELDALAHRTLFGQCVKNIYHVHSSAKRYSTSLDAAALLERELARRGLDEERAEQLSTLLGTDVISSTEYGQHEFFRTDWDAVSENQRASAKQRTIAAILAMQEGK